MMTGGRSAGGAFLSRSRPSPHVVGGIVEVRSRTEADDNLTWPSDARAWISSMPETPLIASSIGSITEVDISSGLAPGSESTTLTVAGSAFG
jgi:hypothetical protein